MGKTKAKTLLISFLLAAVAVCLSVAFVACSGGGDKDKSAGRYGAGEEGIYYYDKDSSTEYLMTLQSGVYMISMDGASGYSGTYSYDDVAMSVSFVTSDGDAFEASFSDDVMQLEIAGTPYTFLKKVDYAVKFMDGSTTVGTQSVTYGKNASKLDAEKDGYIFVGWYEDAAFTTQYKFNTSVTADTTLYAYYIPVDSTIANFEVQFVSGGDVIYTTTTQNGVVYDFPETEALGWWVSATNDENELTYEYKGEILTESTKLFAVKSYTLGASVYGDGLKWNTAVASATITVDGEVVATQATGTSFAYDFDSLSAGRHEITIAASSATENLVYMTKALSRVSNFSVYGTTLVYNAVENAQYYYVSVTCGNPSHDHEMVYNGNTLTYDFSNCVMGPEGISFTVYACAQGYVESVSETYVYALILDGTTVTIDKTTDTASWTTVSGASGYEVYINDEYAATTTDTEYSLKYYDIGDEIAVSVKPVAPGYYSEESATAEYTKATLKAPEITGINEYTVSWTEIEGATNYIIYVNGKQIETVENDIFSYALANDSDFVHADSYVITIKAVNADNTNQNSQESDAVYATDDTMSELLVYEDGTVYWQYAMAAGTYYVTVNDENETAVVGQNSFDVTFTQSGENVVKVWFTTADGNSALAQLSVTAYAIVFDSEGGDIVDTIYVAKGDTLYLPSPSYGDSGEGRFLGWYTLPNPNGLALDVYMGEGVEVSTGDLFDRNSTLILYACWEVSKQGISLNPGSYGELEDTSFQMPVNTQTYTMPVPEATDAAYVFIGWYSEANGRGTRYTDENGNSLNMYTNTNNKTIYAYWAQVLTFKEVTSTVDGSQVLEASKGEGIDLVTSVTVPAEYNGMKVGNISSSAFKDCSSLVTVYIPDTIEYIATVNNGYDSGTGAFAKCSKLSAVYIYETGEPDTLKEVYYYSDEEGVLYKLNSEGGVDLVYYPYAKSGAYVIPEVVYNSTELEYANGMETQQVYRSVTSISTKIFDSNSKLTAVIIPATVKNIDSQAFYYCYKMETVTFNDTVDNQNAVAASSLAFGANAFQKSKLFEEITLPARYTEEFKSSVFDSCSALENIYVSGDNTVYSSVNGMLYNRSGSELLWCPVGRSGEITVAGGTVVIAESAFSSNTAITGVTIPGSVTEIGKNAFKGCTKIEYVTFQGGDNDSDLTIREGAFYGITTSKFTEVELPSNLVKLEVNAFGGCTYLTTVTVHARQNTESIDFAKDAFGSTATTTAYTVTVVYLDKNVPEFEIADVFGKKLEHVYIEEGNDYYWSDENGVVYNKAVTTIIYYPLELSGDYLDMPETITTIAASVFEARTGLTGIYIPKSVVTIGEEAFYGCTKLTYVTFEAGGTEALEIGEYAFRGCTQLTEIAFPERTTVIGDNAFYGCTKLTYVYIPSTVTALGGYDSTGKLVSMNVFYNCTALEKIEVGEGNQSFKTIDGILYAIDAQGNPTELIICPANNAVSEVVIETTVTYIWDKAFYNNTGVKSVSFAGEITIEEDKELFGESVFEGATGLRTVELPVGLTSIPANLFYKCTGLVEVIIPYTVTYIGNAAFFQCSSLTTVTFEGTPAGVAEVALVFEDNEISSNTYYGTFTRCESLEEIVLPERTTTLGKAMFAGYSVSSSTINSYSALRSVTIGKNVTSIPDYAFMGADKLESVTFESGSAMTEIGTYAFGYSGPISGLVLPDSITKMGSYAFRGSQIPGVTLPSGITEIPGDCFRDCQKLVSIVIPKNVESLTTEATSGVGAFYQCYALESVTFEEGSKLEEIGMYCFWFNTSLKSIEIPSSIQTIGACAFWNCTALESITFAKGTSDLNSIGNRTFAYTPITEFAFPETTATTISLGIELFVGCTRLTSITLSNGITELGTSLSKCNTITSIDFNRDEDGEQTNVNFKVDDDQPIMYSYSGESIALVFGEISGEFTVPYYVKSIEANAFQCQVSMTKLYLPTSIELIDDSAFASCTNLTGVYFYTATYELDGQSKTVPAAEKIKIGDYAFAYCTSLTEVNLSSEDVTAADGTVLQGANINRVGIAAFAYCYSLKKVTLPKTLTTTSQTSKVDNDGYIGTYVFAYDYALTDVVFTDETTCLGNYMFQYCTSLTSITVPSTVTSLGTYLFQYSGLEYADLSACSVATLPTYLFRGCENLVSVKLGASVTTLGNYDFSGCTSLTEVVIPNSVTTFGTYTFNGDVNLNKIAQTEKELAEAENGYVNIGSVTSLGAESFYGCVLIKTVILSESLTTMPKEAFYGCTALENIDLSNIVTFSNDSAFYGCTSLKYADLSSVSGVIGTSSFYECTALESVLLGTGVTAIGKYGDSKGVFQYSGLKSITYVGYNEGSSFALPSAITLVGKLAFESTMLESVVVPALDWNSSNSKNKLCDSMFANCVNLTSVSFADGAKYIGSNMFEGCTSLTSIILPETLTDIETKAFYNSGLSYIEMPGVETIGSYAFYGCAFETVSIGESVTSLGSYVFAYNENLVSADLSKMTGITKTLASQAFEYCSKLESVTFPAEGGITAIGSYSFGYCTSLESITLPATVTSLSTQSFIGCTALETIDLSYITGTSIPKECFSGCTSLVLITIPEKVTSIAESAFNGCTALESVTFSGDAVATIDTTAFAGCTSLKEILIPESVTKINAGAFMNSGLESVNIPAGVSTIGNYVFSGCVNLEEITVDASNSKYQTVEGFLCDMDGEILFYPRSLMEDGALVIPEGLKLASYVFAYDGDLRSVTIPGSAEEIPSYAFEYCYNLETVIISEGVTSIATYAFRECTALKTVVYPGTLNSIGTYAFYKDELLEAADLPDGLEEIGQYAYAYCYGLTYVYVPSTVTTIGSSVFRYDSGILEAVVMCDVMGEYMFRDCTSLRKVTLSETIESIPAYAFAGDESLAEINTVGHAEEIGNYAFQNTALVSITLPEGLVSVGTYVFQNCACLEEINLPTTLTTLGNYAFDGCTVLDKVTGGEGLETIGDYAFRNTGLMGGFALSSKVQTIGTNAFQSSRLSSIVLYDNIESIGANAFTGWESTQTIYVACSYYAAFNTWGEQVSNSDPSKYTMLQCFDDCDADIVYNYVV